MTETAEFVSALADILYAQQLGITPRKLRELGGREKLQSMPEKQREKLLSTKKP